MPSAFTHIFVGEALGKACTAEKMPVKFWVLTGACSILPDLDVIAFRLRIPYGNMFGHRGFSHSLLFAAIVGMLAALLAFRDEPRPPRRWWGSAFLFFLVTASHGLLDAMTNGGYGIGFFIPFDKTRYFLPWRPLVVSPIGVHGFLGRWGWEVMKSEFVWIWLPMIALLAGMLLYRRLTKRQPRDLQGTVDH